VPTSKARTSKGVVEREWEEKKGEKREGKGVPK